METCTHQNDLEYYLCTS